MAYPTVYPWIGRLLQDSVRDVANADFDDPIYSAIVDALPTAVRQGQTVGDFYAALTGDDKQAFDEAIGHLVAAKLHPSYSTGGAGGALTSESTEQTKRAFAGAEEMRAEWRAQASLKLASCAFFPVEPEEQRFSGGFYGANGPSRTRAASRGRP